MEQTASFLRRPRRIEELRAEENGQQRPYRIVKTVCLGGMDYENFVTDLLADRAFLEGVPGCGEDGKMRYRAAGSDPRRFYICASNLRKPY